MRTKLDALAGYASILLAIVAGLALVGVMLLTGTDIVGRALRMPIPGAYELVSFAGGLVVGLAVPFTSRGRGHVIVDILVERVSPRTAFGLAVVTRLMGTALFLLMGYSLISMGMQIHASGEVTSVLHLPFYPVAYAMGVAFLVEAVVLLVEMLSQEVKHG